jgi:hypothetical protein
VNSVARKTFSIRNELRGAIQGRLEVYDEELKENTYKGTWIIPNSQVGHFTVGFYSGECKEFSSTVTYIINERHKFQFKVTAEVVKVRLEIEKTSLEFKFSEDNHQMFTSEKLSILNPGNAPANYEFRIGRNSLFEFDPRIG